MIRPGFLPVSMSTSNRIIKPGYETYQPVIAARQFGLGQVPPHFHIWQPPHSNTSRSVLHSLINRLLHMVGNVENSCFQKSFRSSTAANWSWICNPRRRGTESMHLFFLSPLSLFLANPYSLCLQQQNGAEPVANNGEPFHFLPTAPDVLFCKGSPSMKKVIMTIQPDFFSRLPNEDKLLQLLPPES